MTESSRGVFHRERTKSIASVFYSDPHPLSNRNPTTASFRGHKLEHPTRGSNGIDHYIDPCNRVSFITPLSTSRPFHHDIDHNMDHDVDNERRHRFLEKPDIKQRQRSLEKLDTLDFAPPIAWSRSNRYYGYHRTDSQAGDAKVMHSPFLRQNRFYLRPLEKVGKGAPISMNLGPQHNCFFSACV